MPIDYSKYHPEWKSRISPYIRFERAENKCEECGAENYKPHPITDSRVILTVAHLDHDTSNNSDENLKALCQKCHLSHDKSDNLNRRKYGKKYNEQSKLF